MAARLLSKIKGENKTETNKVTQYEIALILKIPKRGLIETLP